MRLSEVLPDWPEKKDGKGKDIAPKILINGYNTARTACDHEIDREALAKELYEVMYGFMFRWQDEVSNVEKELFRIKADHLISTMPAWLRKVSEK